MISVSRGSKAHLRRFVSAPFCAPPCPKPTKRLARMPGSWPGQLGSTTTQVTPRLQKSPTSRDSESRTLINGVLVQRCSKHRENTRCEDKTLGRSRYMRTPYAMLWITWVADTRAHSPFGAHRMTGTTVSAEMRKMDCRPTQQATHFVQRSIWAGRVCAFACQRRTRAVVPPATLTGTRPDDLRAAPSALARQQQQPSRQQ